MRPRRGSGCLISEVRILAEPGWQCGPAPIRLPSRPEVVDRRLRLTYFEPRLQDVLYGSVEAPVRWHQLYETPKLLAGVPVRAAELLRMPFPSGQLGLAVLHVDLLDDPVESLERLSQLTSVLGRENDRAALQEFLPDGVSLSSGSKSRTIAHVSFAGGPEPVMSARYGEWKPVDQWLWLLASASTEALFAPDPDDPVVHSGTVYFSADWKALVLRDGTAFVGMSPDPGGDCFHALAEVHVHSIYLDALLVGCMQLYALNGMANRMAETDTARLDSNVLADLENHLINVRRRLWFSHITVRGKGNEVLRQFQIQHALPALLEDIVSELADAGRLVETLTNRSLNAALGLLTVLGLPVGVAFSAGAVWGSPHPQLFLMSTLAAVAGGAVLMVVVPHTRRMLTTIWRKDRAE